MGKILKNRGAASVITAVLVLAAILFGSHRSLAGLRARVDGAFQHGVDGDGYSIASDLEKRDAAAYNMTAIAQRYYEEDEPRIEAVREARDALAGADTVGEKAKANRALEESVTALHGLLKNTDLSEKDEKYPDRLYDEFKSRGKTITNDGYNLLAGEYNQALRQFPANLLAGLTGIRPAELF